MKVSLKWISKYLDIHDYTPQSLADIISKAGTEIEEIHYLSSGTNLCIGEIIECTIHPNSDHLHICQVNLGNEIVQIVCGAPNCRKNLKVIVAKPGARLPINGGLTIEKGTIRGIESNGMLCSLLELGVDEKMLSEAQKAGIEELFEDAKVGDENPLGYLGLDDVIYEFKTLPNRGDVLSIYSLALEIGACINRKARLLEKLELTNLVKTEYKATSNTDLCKYFGCREVRDITVKSSPKWLKQYLMACGIRSINNIVDIGNYVMLLTGQPIHMYDADKLKNKNFIICNDLQTRVIALDDKEYSLEQGDIAIMNGTAVACIAGVIGDKSTMVDANTKNIIIETAIFDGVQIRKTSQRLQMFSDSSQRFIRGIDKNRSKYANDLAASLLLEFAEAKSISEISLYDHFNDSNTIIEVKIEQINHLLGTNYSENDLLDVLERLTIQYQITADTVICHICSHRKDLLIWQDIAEEIIRIKGFDGLIETIPPSVSLGEFSEVQHKRKLIRNLLIDNGLNETLNYTLSHPKYDDDFNIFNRYQTVKLALPMSEERSMLRKSIVHSLLLTINYNQNRKTNDMGIFEISNIYTMNGQNERLGIVLTSEFKQTKWLKTNPADFYTLKGIIETIMNTLGIDASRFSYEKIEAENLYYHPGRAAYLLVGKKKIGVIGQIHPLMEKKYDISSCFAAEIDLDEVMQMKSGKIKFEEPSIYPFINRDIALVINQKIAANDIIKVIKKNGKGIVSNVEIFDVYQGSNLAPNTKSIAISIAYQDKNKTLTDLEIMPIHNAILLALEKELAAELRK